MKPLQAFTEIKTLEDFKSEMKQSLKYLGDDYLDPEAADLAIEALGNLPEERQAEFIKYIHHVDKTLSYPGAAEANRHHKIPTILAGLIYYYGYWDKIKDLNMDEIAILSRFSAPKYLQFYENSVEYFDKPILSAIALKISDYMFRGSFIDAADLRLQKGENKETIAEHITNTPLDELKQEGVEAYREKYREIGKYLWE